MPAELIVTMVDAPADRFLIFDFIFAIVYTILMLSIILSSITDHVFALG